MNEMEIEPYPTGGTKEDIANWMAQWGPTNVDEMMQYIADQKYLVAERRAAAEAAAGGPRSLVDLMGPNYEGEMKIGLAHGQGIYCYANGDHYDGEWKDGKRDGRGIYYFVDGAIYDGEWKDGKRDGRGLQISSNGSLHWYRWKEGLPHGYGIWEHHDGQQTYEGDFEGYNRNGQGIDVGADGSIEEGIWINDKCIRKTRVSNNYSVSHLEQLGEELVIFKKKTPVAFERKKREFNSLIERALEETIICPQRHEDLRLLQETVGRLVGAEKKKRSSRYIPEHVKQEVYERDGGRCVACGSTEKIQYDHDYPFKAPDGSNGSNSAENIQLLCQPCNGKKSNKIGLG